MKKSDEWWEERGFKKVFIPELDAFGWTIELDFSVEGDNILETTNLVLLETLLEISLEQEDYEKAALIRDRIEQVKAD